MKRNVTKSRRFNLSCKTTFNLHYLLYLVDQKINKMHLTHSINRINSYVLYICMLMEDDELLGSSS